MSDIRGVSTDKTEEILWTYAWALGWKKEPQPRPTVTYTDAINKRGNTPGNIINGGTVTVQGQWLYHSIVGLGMSIDKSRRDRFDQYMLCNEYCSYINVVGDWIYYINDSEGGIICKGKSTEFFFKGTVFSDDNARDLSVVGDWIYYRNWGKKLFKMRTDGTGRQKLGDHKCDSINVIGDFIYYSNLSDGAKIYKMRTDGTNVQKLNNDKSEYVNVTDDFVYYSNRNLLSGKKLYRMRTDGSDVQKLNDDASSYLNVDGGFVYYINGNDGDKIYRIRTDGSGRQRLNNAKSWKINIADDWIYHSCTESQYRTRTDGSRSEKLEYKYSGRA
jgi:hypothetical protein